MELHLDMKSRQQSIDSGREIVQLKRASALIVSTKGKTLKPVNQIIT